MKKSLIAGAGVAAFAFAAFPFALASATQQSVKDNLNVTISETCSLTRVGQAAATGAVITASQWSGATGSTEGTYTVTMIAGKAAQIGTSTLTTICNDTTAGYSVSAAFTGLADNASHTIAYDGSAAATDGASRWNITNNGSLVTASEGTGVIYANTKVPTSGTTNTIVYNVSTSTDQAAGAYEGSATYTLTYAQ